MKLLITIENEGGDTLIQKPGGPDQWAVEVCCPEHVVQMLRELNAPQSEQPVRLTRDQFEVLVKASYTFLRSLAEDPKDLPDEIAAIFGEVFDALESLPDNEFNPKEFAPKEFNPKLN